MICRSCLRKASRPHLTTTIIKPSRFLSTTHPLKEPAPISSTPSNQQPFSTPLAPSLAEINLNISTKPKPKSAPIVSIAPAGMILKGLKYMKDRDEVVALPEDEYPEWLWRCLDKKAVGEGEGEVEGDEFSKSKKLRRKAAKRQRKLEAAALLSGNTDALMPKIPLTQQSIDLPSNAEGTVEGALGAVEGREELRKQLRTQRRRDIKQKNYLKSM